MLNFYRSVRNSKDKTFSCYWGPLVSKTINIFANATNSSLYISSTRPLRQRPFPSLNIPSRILNLEGFSWQKGYRNPLGFVSYKKSYQKFLDALHLCLCVRQRGGNIHVIFDGDQFMPHRDGLQAQPFMYQGQHNIQFGTSGYPRKIDPTRRAFDSHRAQDVLSNITYSAINSKTGHVLVLPVPSGLALASPAKLAPSSASEASPCLATLAKQEGHLLRERSKRSKAKGTSFESEARHGQQRNQRKQTFTFLNCNNLNIKQTPPVYFTNLYKIKKNFDSNYNWSGDKWVGGTFSNFKQISKSINLYKTISRQFLEILENQISSRYLGMANKFHGNIGSTEPRKNKYDVFHYQKGRALERPKASLKLLPLFPKGLPPSGRAKLALSQARTTEARGVPHGSALQGQPPSSFAYACQARQTALSPGHKKSNGNALGAKRQNQDTPKHNHHYSPKYPKLSIFNEILKHNQAKNLRNTNLPDLVIIENAEKYKNVIAEAQILKIPVIAFVESNTVSNISIPLPLNSLKHYFLAFLLQTISKTPSFS